ncbi:MAG: methionine adenosyltransferase domain-containing protein [Chitinophagaceae bacterium]
MQRMAEAVLNGHPDKFSDLIADALVKAYCAKEPDAYVQIEVAIWSDLIFLTGFAATRQPISIPVRDIIVELGQTIGYSTYNHIDASRYIIHNHICQVRENPTQWTDYVNDQSIVMGYACGDALTHFLPTEQFLVWYFREAILKSIHHELLHGQGPDGKLLVNLTASPTGWYINQLLVTLQHNKQTSLFDVCDYVMQTLREAYETLQNKDPRWLTPWYQIPFLFNPNGPFIQGGSDSDNGQTGRKLVMDFYGPHTPIGGGAFYGKDLHHIDRLGAIQARHFAVNQVASGAESALVQVSYAPGIDTPLSVVLQSNQPAYTSLNNYFNASTMRRQRKTEHLDYSLFKLGTFYNEELSFNNPSSV